MARSALQDQGHRADTAGHCGIVHGRAAGAGAGAGQPAARVGLGRPRSTGELERSGTPPALIQAAWGGLVLRDAKAFVEAFVVIRLLTAVCGRTAAMSTTEGRDHMQHRAVDQAVIEKCSPIMSSTLLGSAF
ncbi:hypothetical protein E4U24_007288 [Claviceps purpurea]|nr:hypothetical protein E4U24_007288 [Claviceps purpurea]